MQKITKNRIGTITQLCRAVSSQLRHVSTIGKNLLNSNTSSTCPHNMVNFGPLTAEIGLAEQFGTPLQISTGFAQSCMTVDRTHGSDRVGSAALLHGTLVVGVSQTLRR